MASKQDSSAIISRKEVFALVKKFKTHLIKIGIPIQEVYIFGSYSNGIPHYGSDIDVCVISPVFKDKFESNLLLRREALKVDLRLEPIAYSPEKFQDWIPLVAQIQQTGTAV